MNVRKDVINEYRLAKIKMDLAMMLCQHRGSLHVQRERRGIAAALAHLIGRTASELARQRNDVSLVIGSDAGGSTHEHDGRLLPPCLS